MNPQPPVLETGALPIELLACAMCRARPVAAGSPCIYFDSRCTVCVRHHRQYFLNSSRPVVFRLFLVVL